MSTATPPLPPRDQRIVPRPESARQARQRSWMVLVVMVVVIGVSVVLSVNWSGDGFTPEAPTQVFLAVLVASIIYFAFRYSVANTRRCTACGRPIPRDATLCPYCGQRLS